jgi:hypothetical protein
MWMPARAREPPRSNTLRAMGTNPPAGAKMMALSSFSGGSYSVRQVQAAHRLRARAWCSVLRVKT